MRSWGGLSMSLASTPYTHFTFALWHFFNHLFLLLKIRLTIDCKTGVAGLRRVVVINADKANILYYHSRPRGQPVKTSVCGAC